MYLNDNRYFTRKEFACKCGCGFDTIDYELLIVLDDIRKFFNKPVIINSSCRCEEHNRNIGGSPNSQHTKGRAADIVIKDITPKQTYTYLIAKYPDKYGIGLYDTFTHIDTRGFKARW